MSFFSKLTTDGLEKQQDRTGGSGGYLKESDIYTLKIKQAFAGNSVAGAMSVTIIADIDSQEYKETLYVTSKQGLNYYTREGSKVPLPAFSIMNNICLICTGKALSDQDVQEKVVNVYDPESKKEMPKAVPVLVDLIGTSFSAGIIKEIQNKNVKDSNGIYVPTEEFRETNSINSVFDTVTKMTVSEAIDGREAAFWNSWLEANKGKTKDRRTVKEGQSSSETGKSLFQKPAESPKTTPAKSLFSK